MAIDDQNWDINSYNTAYGNNLGFNYPGEEDWYNYDNAPPTGIQ